MHGILPQIGISLLAATALGFIFQYFRQPVILGYLVAGALIGPEIGFKLVSEPESIEVISEIGLILLLFIIGLEINPKHLISSGKKLIFTGIGQFIVCAVMGFGFFLLPFFHLKGAMDALYLALFCGLSSTAIVVKILFDKFELDTLPGRLTIGILIFQDIWAILILALQPNFTNPNLLLVCLALLKSAGLLAAGYLLSRYVMGWIYGQISKTPEMVVAMSIAWCALMAGIGSFIGLSMEMGALIAGVSISAFPYSVHVSAKVLPLRDFFLTLFFLSIGMKIPAPDTGLLVFSAVIVLFVILSRFFSIYPILAYAGSGRRTCFITSLNLAQISEFSLVVAALGVGYGHIDQRLLSLIIYAMAFTSVLTSYAIKGNHQLYLVFDRLLSKFGFPSKDREVLENEEKQSYPVVLLGYHRGARAFIERISLMAPRMLSKIMVIDYNPELLKKLNDKGIKGVFGDISSLDTLEHVHVSEARVIVSTIPDMLLKGTSNQAMVKACRALAPQATIVATADEMEQVVELKSTGANEVLLPYSLMGRQLVDIVLHTFEGEGHPG